MPFTYLLGWSAADKWYIGARWAEGCAPADLWSKYFTSSKYVSEFRQKYGEPDVIEIDRVFDSKKDALEREIFLLKVNRVKEQSRFLNKAIGGVFDPADPAIREKCAAAHRGVKQSLELIKKRTAWKRGVPHSAEHAEAISKALTGAKYDEARKQKMSLAMLGKKHRLGTTTSEQGRRNIGLSKVGMQHSQETKLKMSQAHRGRKHSLATCPHCGKIGGVTAMPRWHFDNCKFKE